MTEEELATVQARFKNVEKVCPLSARELAVWRNELYTHDPSYGTEPNPSASDWQRFLATFDVLEAENARLRAALELSWTALTSVPWSQKVYRALCAIQDIQETVAVSRPAQPGEEPRDAV